MPKKDERRGGKLEASWTLEEDAALDHAVLQVGESWGLVADMVNLAPNVLTRRRWTAEECKDHYYMKEENGARAPAACKPWFYIEAIIEAVNKKREANQDSMIIDEAGAAQPPRVSYPAPTPQQPGQFNMAVQPGMPAGSAAPPGPGGVPAVAGVPVAGQAPARLTNLSQLAGSITSEADPLSLVQLKDAKAVAAAEAAEKAKAQAQANATMLAAQLKAQQQQQPVQAQMPVSASPGMAQQAPRPGFPGQPGVAPQQYTPEQLAQAQANLKAQQAQQAQQAAAAQRAPQAKE